MAITVHAAPPNARLTVWLSRDGESIRLLLGGSAETLSFQEQRSGTSEPSHWEILDKILRTTGK
jgi:hypothetical protein